MLNALKVQFHLFRRWFFFYRRAVTLYDIHSPFVAGLVKALLEDRRWFYVFSDISGLRDYIAQNKQVIPQSNFGAGSQILLTPGVSVAKLGQTVAVDDKSGRLLFRLVNFLKPKYLLEMGSSLGLSAIFQAAGSLDGQLISIEGSPEISQLARQHVDGLGYKNIHIVNGVFSEQLPEVLQQLPQLDYVYLDGDHRLKPTLSYFESCLPHLHTQSAFVLADIYWSDEMLEAWEQLKLHPRVNLSVDFYDFGILFFREEQRQKEHFAVVPKSWKPWRLGFWS
ncbi:MAG: class I SAM-dependent methyltransferase [Saprospiraceae bacterium]